MIFRTILFFINLVLGGFIVKKFLLKDSPFLSCALFLGGYATMIFWSMLLGLRLNVIVLNLPLALIPLFLLGRGGRRKEAPAARRFSAVDLVLAAGICAVLVLGIFHVMKAPIYERDGLGLWLTKAKEIALDRTFMSDNFLDPLRVQDSPRYPLLLPMLEAGFMFQAGLDELAVKLVFVYFWILILGVLFEGLARESLRAGLLAALALAVIPAYYVMADGSLHTGYADIPLSLFYLGAGVALTNFLENGPRRSLCAAGLFAAFSAFTKNEGWAFGLCLLVVLILARRKAADIALFLAFALAASAPWLLAMTRLPAARQENYLANLAQLPARLGKTPLIVKNSLLEFLDVRHWGLFWPAAAGASIALKPPPAVRLMGFAVAATVVCYLSAYSLSTWDISFQMSVSFARLLLQVLPLTVLLCGRALIGRALTWRRGKL